MGMALLCDGCQIDISAANKVSVQVAALDGSSVQLDFCWECSKPIRQMDAVKGQMREKRMSIREQQIAIASSLTEPTPMPPLLNDNADVDPDEEVVTDAPAAQ
jgi:hypothetical protein